MNKYLLAENGDIFFYKGKDVHTKHGYIKAVDIDAAKDGAILETNMGKKMHLVPASFADLYRKIKRSAQIIPRKDVGIIVAETGLSPDWKIVDGGAGSGGLSCFLAHLVPKGKVNTYDIRDDHIKIVEHNIELLGLKNIEVKKGNLYEEIPHKNIDLITLDVPEPWNVLDNAAKALRVGGFLVNYSPSIPQTSDFIEAVKTDGRFHFVKSVEVISREWEFSGRKIRPKTRQEIGHSGFITFVRRI